MKVYAVVFDNGDKFGNCSYWVESIHASREGAERYIKNRKNEFDTNFSRIRQLCMIDDGELTEDEKMELGKLVNTLSKWKWGENAEIVEISSAVSLVFS